MSFRKTAMKYAAPVVASVAVGTAHAAGLTSVSDTAGFLGAIDLGDTRSIILSVGAGLGVLGAVYMAVRKGLGLLGWR